MSTEIVIYYDELSANHKIGMTKQHVKVINDSIVPLYQQLLIGNLTTEVFKDMVAGSKQLTKDCHELADSQLNAQGFAGKSLRTSVIGEIDSIILKINTVITDLKNREQTALATSATIGALQYVTIDVEGKATITKEAESQIKDEFTLKTNTDKGQKVYQKHLKAVEAINAFFQATCSGDWRTLTFEELFQLDRTGAAMKVLPAVLDYDRIAV